MQRQQMSKKDALMEEAAMSVAGIQRMHVIGLVVLFIIVVTIFGLLRMKAITWAMMLLTNLAFFLYLVKLLVSTGTDGATDGEACDISVTDEDGYSEFSMSRRSLA